MKSSSLKKPNKRSFSKSPKKTGGGIKQTVKKIDTSYSDDDISSNKRIVEGQRPQTKLSPNQKLNDNDIDYLSEEENMVIVSDTIFDQDTVEVEIWKTKTITVADKFPNALLIIEDETPETTKPEPESSSEKEIDVWDLLDKVGQRDNHQSDSLDGLSTLDDTIDSLTFSRNKQDANQKNRCLGCGAIDSFIEDSKSGLVVCTECSMVHEELLDHGPEWRKYNNDDGRGEGVSRCGCPTNYFFPKSSMGTVIVGAGSNRLKRKQQWSSVIYRERSLTKVFEYITKMCTLNEVSKIIADTTKTLYKHLSDCKHKTGPSAGKPIIIRGTNRKSIIAACLFKACEINKDPRSVKEVAEYFGLDEKKLTKGNKQFEKFIKDTSEYQAIADQASSTITEDYIRRCCPKLHIEKKYADIAVKIAVNSCKMKLASDHNPRSVAAGSIMAAISYLKLKTPRHKVAKLFKTSDTTISKIQGKIYPYVQALVDDEATDYIIEKFKING